MVTSIELDVVGATEGMSQGFGLRDISVKVSLEPETYAECLTVANNP
jgi:hypothetical protein